MEELIEKQFEIIPEALQEYFNSDELYAHIDKVLKDQPLQDVQKDAFMIEAMLVVLQVESVEMFAVNIKHGMEIAMKRAEEISKKTKQEVFLPVQEYLMQKPNLTQPPTEKIASDGIVSPQDNLLPNKETARTLNHEIPLEDVGLPKKEVPKPPHPIVAPAPPEVVPTAKEKILQTPKIPEGDSLGIFKKRLQEPVHTPVEETQLSDGERKVENTNPSTKETIENDPYKESF